TWPADGLTITIDHDTMRATSPLPHCPDCETVARPNILMFGDYHWVPGRSQRILDAVTAWRRGLAGKRLVVLEIGAGTAVPRVRRMAELASAGGGARIRITPREPEIRHGRGISLPMRALDTLSQLDERLR